METIPAIFDSKDIRKTLHNGEWWFAVSDVVKALTDSDEGNDVLRKIRKHDDTLSKEWGRFITPLWLDSPDGREEVECTATAGVFRFIQTINSPKAEECKCWLARVGYARMREIENPELSSHLTVSLYKAKGYSETWIAKRMHGIAVRATLKKEWQDRGVNGEKEHAILAAEISKNTFGITPQEYKELKGLERENLRDHMSELELIFSMLGEAAAAEIARKQNIQGFIENRTAALKGGRIAGETLKKLEQEIDEKLVRRENYLNEPESQKRLARNNTKRQG